MNNTTKHLKQHVIIYILGLIGLAIPLLSFINEKWIDLFTYVNPLAFITGAFTLAALETLGLQTQGDTLFTLVAAIESGLIYFFIGLLIEKLIRKKSTLSLSIATLIIIIFVVGSYFVGRTIVSGLGAL